MYSCLYSVSGFASLYGSSAPFGFLSLLTGTKRSFPRFTGCRKSVVSQHAGDLRRGAEELIGASKGADMLVVGSREDR
jgi:hypothetical protein